MRKHDKLNFMIFICLSMLVVAFIVDTPKDIFLGLQKIIVSPDILLTDYLEVGGMGATFVNASIMGLINIYLLKRYKSDITGLSIAALWTVIGFSFIGKNLFNFWPIYLGGYLYSRVKNIKFDSIILVLMFATTLSPVVSELTFGSYLPTILGFLVGVGLGMFVGFIIVPVSATIFKAHQGYNLYNVGLAGGLIGTLIVSLLRSFNLIFQVQDILSTKYHLQMALILSIMNVLLILYGILYKGASKTEYKALLKRTGQSPSDFLNDYNEGTTYVNMGILGFIAMFYVWVHGGTFNGPIIAGIFTVVGFAAFGKTPKNVIPVLIGVSIASQVKVWDESSTVVLIGGLFGTTLAPVAGEFGILSGIFAGFLHLSMVMNIGIIHGGSNLYNNGFAGGIVSIILVAVLIDLLPSKKHQNDNELDIESEV